MHVSGAGVLKLICCANPTTRRKSVTRECRSTLEKQHGSCREGEGSCPLTMLAVDVEKGEAGPPSDLVASVSANLGGEVGGVRVRVLVSIKKATC